MGGLGGGLGANAKLMMITKYQLISAYLLATRVDNRNGLAPRAARLLVDLVLDELFYGSDFVVDPNPVFLRVVGVGRRVPLNLSGTEVPVGVLQGAHKQLYFFFGEGWGAAHCGNEVLPLQSVDLRYTLFVVVVVKMLDQTELTNPHLETRDSLTSKSLSKYKQALVRSPLPTRPLAPLQTLLIFDTSVWSKGSLLKVKKLSIFALTTFDNVLAVKLVGISGSVGGTQHSTIA